MPFLILFLVSWAAFFLFADRSAWRRYLPACMLAIVMSLTSDVAMMHHPLWRYYDWDATPLTLPYNLLDDFGVYPVTTYLFLQYFPHFTSRLKQFRYFFYWTCYAVTLEFLFCQMGWMVHSDSWSLGYSYAADWLIYFLLLRFFWLYHGKETSFAQLGLHLDFLLERDTMEVILLTAQPGAVIPQHTHPTDELMILLKGELELDVAGEIAPMPHRQSVLIKSGVRHAGRNLGSEPVLLLTVLAPPTGLRERIDLYVYEKIAVGETLEL